eukprot:TRINITY_DN46984_c0_g1_i1.p1 TRINITY_DN46984_c0_g1~~TRINITY_DN46984_c0_g1_i1.p1  ORF type:complete len:127 (+),score=39.91 TRINITY_DN46984_c0_g1_i1:52-381(+)
MSTEEKTGNDGWFTKTKVAGAVVGAGAAIVAPYAVLAGLGFTAKGVAAGSLAAGIQAGVGNVAAGSAFAAAQSIGVAGFSAATTVCTTAICAATGAVTGSAVEKFNKKS